MVETRALRRSDVVKTALFRSVSHDLRSPLTAIVASAEALEAEDPDDAELAEGIAAEGRRLARLVDDLLDLSRLEAGSATPRRTWCALEEVLEAALGRLPPMRRSSVQIEEGLPMLQADPAQLERAFANLLDNSRVHGGAETSACAPGGPGHRIRVRVSDQVPGSPPGAGAGVRALPPGGRRHLRRRRPGPRDRPRVHRGQRRDPEGGVGARQGASFVTELPMRVRPRTPRRRGGVVNTVLVVDDERQILRALRVILTQRGVRGGRGRRRRAGTGPGRRDASPDAAIIDLVLPDGDGADVCAQIRGWSQMPILVLSAVGDETEKIRALDGGADDYVTKPFSSGELVARLRAALRRRRARPPKQPGSTVEDLEVDFAATRCGERGEPVHLTPTEFELLRTLVRNRGRPDDPPDAARRGVGPSYEEDAQVLRVHIANLRRKLEDDTARPRFITTDPGVGYRFSACHRRPAAPPAPPRLGVEPPAPPRPEALR